MAKDQKANRVGNHSAAALVKSMAVCLGLITVGYVTVTAVNHALPLQSEATGFALEHRTLNSGAPVELRNPRPPRAESQVTAAYFEGNIPTDSARECAPDEGITDACIFL